MKIHLMVFLAVLCLTSLSVAQNFCCVLYEQTQQLDSICGGSTHPIADGTIIQIMWDRGATGPSPEDTLAPACVCDNCRRGTVNFNTFTFNGTDPNIGLLPGQFYTLDYAFCSNDVLPTPDTFYLMVCLPGRHYYSNTFSPTVGYSEFELGPWTCLNQPCTGSPIPQAPTNFAASDSTTCNGVNLSWSYPDTVHELDGFALFRNDSCRIAQVGPAARAYLDATAVSGTRFTYFVEALRHAGTDTAYSAWQTDFGSWALQAHPMPNDSLVDSYVMDFTHYSYHVTPALAAGANYYLRVTGVYRIATPWWADAAFCFSGCGGIQPIDYWLWNGSTAQRPTPDTYNPDHVYYYPFVGNGTSEEFMFNDGMWNDNAGSLTIQVWRRVSCPPTALPFVEYFDGQTIDSCWYWLREDGTHHSLAARPGWMRITTQGGEVASDAHNILLRSRLTDDVVLETHLAFAPTTNYQQAGLVLWMDSTQHVLFHRYYSGGQKLMFRGDHAGSSYDYSSYIANADTNLYLRLSTNGTLVTASYSTNATTWTTFGSHDFPWLSDSTQIGIFACNGSNYTAPQIRADFDYVSIQPNCPKYVSGAWTLSHSPYRVTCETIVPVGQTLTIEPGVYVRFEADVQLQVLGNLVAEGTATDSITFWADTLQNPERWGGVRILNASGEDRFKYCKFLYGNANGAGNDGMAGALYADSSRVLLKHCLFAHNKATTVGAVNLRKALTGSFVDSCAFIDNVTQPNGGSGALRLSWNGVPVSHCLFVGNRATWGGALEVANTNGMFANCTFVNNQATTGGGIGLSWSAATQTYNSCIFTQNGTHGLFNLENGGTASINYSDVADMAGGFSNHTPPAGFGVKTQVNVNGDSVDVYHNLFMNPQFADSVIYALTLHSPCVNAGDPALPRDLDGTLTDQGYLWTNVYPPCVQQVQGLWTLSQSPYLVSCNLVVPIGQSLTIQPGVQVKFIGDYMLIVNGTLSAEGSPQDSITFWADTLTNPSRWGGVRFIHAIGTNRLSYCKFLNASNIASDTYQEGGAVYDDHSLLTIRHCRFENNQAEWGGAIELDAAPIGSLIDSCVLIGNRSIQSGVYGAGGAVAIYHNPIPISNTLFAHNRANLGGALDISIVTSSISRCTFVDNTATTGGAISYSWAGHPQFNSCIFSQNGTTNVFRMDGGATVSAVYSDVADMAGGFSNVVPPGFGVKTQVNVNGDSADTYHNLFMDPLFANTSDYSLAWNSHCFDAGDPALPHDADGTVVDQGYVSYYQPTLTASPDSLDFGQVLCGNSATIAFNVRNNSPTRAHLDGYSRSNPIFTMDSTAFPAWLMPGDSVSLAVHCTPVTEGEFSDTLKIASRLAGPDNVTIALHVSVPFVPIDPESLVVKVGAPGNIELHWAPVTHSTSGHPITPQYNVYEATSPGGPFTLLATSPTNSYTHVGVVGALPRLYYRVTAVAQDNGSRNNAAVVVRDSVPLRVHKETE